MLIYEFECPDGDIFFEERLSLSQLDEVVVKCPTFLVSRGRSNPSGSEVDFGGSGAEEVVEPGAFETPEAPSLSHPVGCTCC